MTFGSGCLATGVGVFIFDGFLVRGGTAAMHRNASKNSFHTLQLNFNLKQEMALHYLVLWVV